MDCTEVRERESLVWVRESSQQGPAVYCWKLWGRVLSQYQLSPRTSGLDQKTELRIFNLAHNIIIDSIVFERFCDSNNDLIITCIFDPFFFFLSVHLSMLYFVVFISRAVMLSWGLTSAHLKLSWIYWLSLQHNHLQPLTMMEMCWSTSLDTSLTRFWENLLILKVPVRSAHFLAHTFLLIVDTLSLKTNSTLTSS